MQKFDGISFLWALILLSMIGLAYAVRAFLGFRGVAKDAAEDYAYKKERGMLDSRLSEDGYIRLFKRLHNPRRPAYIAAAIFLIICLTWPIMAVLSVLLEQLYQLTGRNRVFEPGFLVWQFSIFFSIIFSWTGLAYFMARRYHMRAPGTPAYETEQQILEEQTGSREKVVYDNDWGLPPFMVIGGVFFGFAAIIYRIFFR
ncbi:hypothetical protein [Hellea balneolensis]|uniref:hypothetical protein n=1 Tax=Hellea balneolensis TaxID=287478 RepID=UPI00041DABF3|nr:hypothetical protein [Hellea balneolensis]